MFEKDAEEYAIGLTYPNFQDNPIANMVLRDVEGAFQKGAEFGYNKANEELKQAKKLLEKWLFFNGFNSALKKETEDFLGKKTRNRNTRRSGRNQMAKRIGADDFKEVVLAILETDLDNEECAEIITFIADGYFERTDE